MDLSPCPFSIRRLFFVVSICSACVATFVSVKGAPTVFNRTLTFEERLGYQRKIEEVYWHSRIWPKERTEPKPALETVMSAQKIEEKVRDYLRNSSVLDTYWQQPISSGQLQAEMERMAQHTKNPEMLRELFEALGDDPSVIAECLARPALSDRLVNEYYQTNLKLGTQPKLRAASASDTIFSGYSLPSLTSAAGVCTNNTWSPVADVPAFRSLHSTVWTGSEMIVWGGRQYDESLGTGDRYNPATDSWSKVSATNAPAARDGHTAVWTGTEMIVWGGNLLNSGGRYDPASDTWRPTSLNNAPVGRSDHTAVWTGSVMVVWGGLVVSQDPAAAYSNTGGLYDPKTDTWTAVTNVNAPAGRFANSVVWTGNEMVVWGGENYYGSLNNGARYNPALNTWTTMSALNAPGARYSHSAVWTGTEMIIWGGSHLSDGARYNPASDSWVALTAANPPEARFGHSAVWTGSEMIVWGGPFWVSGGRYNPGTNTWTPVSVTNAPSARETPAIWTGHEMIIFGGGDQRTFNTAGRYDPTADTWTPVRTTNTPADRSGHTAVWTGSEMIVWGGGTSAPILTTNTGGRYDPALDTWTPTSTVNAPVARQGHTAVWTGSEMIVWGGAYSDSQGGHILNTGGRYDPATNNWSPTTLTNAPDRRQLHSCVWTGAEMIVWGGNSDMPGNAAALVNTGGRYNPKTDSWVATSTTNAPSPRAYHTGVWTGSEMIIWGGGYYAAGNTGGKYDPATDSWIATSTVDTAARFGHTAVWTGKEMIVWGASNGSVHVNTGAKYNPNTDTWIATSLFNAPDARIGHAAVWTGDEMIVWGGYNYEQNRFFNTGGRYNPTTDSWSATTIFNAPHAVDSPSGVWTGSRMIVFGGFFSFRDVYGEDHGFVRSTGGEYCANFNPPPVRLANIATRAFVQTGDNVMIGGLIVTGSAPKKVILRAIGPSLSNFGITGALQNPVLELHDSSGLLVSNDNWIDASNKQAIIDSGLAPSNNLESAILTSLNPGTYTAIIRGVDNGTGTAVVEAYDLDQGASSRFNNISTRAFVQTGDNAMIGGLIVTGSAPENVVVRAIGPSLAQLGVANALTDPFLELYNDNGMLIASNDNWVDAANKQAIIDSSLAPSNHLESAILADLKPGSYTAIVSHGTGVALVEIFALD
jgi:N-acetylneuraminic acid mutarotase